MGVNLFTFVGLFDRALTTLDHVLDTGAEFARSKGASEAEMLEWRLIDDMNPLRFQAYVAINFARQWPARAAGLEVPADIAADLDFAGLKAAIGRAKAELAALDPKSFDGREDIAITRPVGPNEMTLPGAQWVTGFATTNIYFHLSMAYAILRQRGAPLGKRDFFAGGF